MKKFYFAILFLPLFSYAQSPVTNSPAIGEEVPSTICLSCPGSDWQSPMNVTAADNMYASAAFSMGGNCFQSTCFYSRYLYAHQFNFAIPGNATIDSIFVDILGRVSSANSVKDSLVQLQKVASIIPTNLSTQNFWSTNATTYSFGAADPLWSTTWLPSDMNDPNTGVLLKMANVSATNQVCGVDHIQMTIYYSTPLGNFSVTSSPSEISWITSPVKNSAHVFTNEKTNCVSNLYDVTGNLLQSENKNNLPVGENEIELQTAQLASGIYFWQIQVGDKLFTRKIFIGENE